MQARADGAAPQTHPSPSEADQTSMPTRSTLPKSQPAGRLFNAVFTALARVCDAGADLNLQPMGCSPTRADQCRALSDAPVGNAVGFLFLSLSMVGPLVAIPVGTPACLPAGMSCDRPFCPSTPGRLGARAWLCRRT
jgi:hypothetical protein